MKEFMITQIKKNLKVLKKSTHSMDFDLYSERLADLSKFLKEF